jgi:hypothetical protein
MAVAAGDLRGHSVRGALVREAGHRPVVGRRIDRSGAGGHGEFGDETAGRVFWPSVSPVVALPAVVNFAVAWRSNTTYRRWWLAAGAAMMVYAVASYEYFVPQMLAFRSGDQ